MSATKQIRPHTFHIPVMGTGFTIDSPIKVARYGITSVVSLVDDVLVEKMRGYYCKQAGEPYEEIARFSDDWRARRITSYLDLMKRIVDKQSEALRAAPFEPGSEITRYFELLPEGGLRDDYEGMLKCADPAEKQAMQRALRQRVVPGDIDVNIMTKVDCDNYVNGEKLPPEYSDAMAALRGFANSGLSSSIVLSAGMNPKLYSYAATFKDFFPDASGVIKKRIVLKVSDYRSAEIQGKFLAKKGLWVSEYRIESGLNCGGHAFPSTGHLMGPILREFRDNRAKLIDTLAPMYMKALKGQGMQDAPVPQIRITVQGGIGTFEENDLLLKYYEVDGTGWGTPFMLVPEATSVDDEHLTKLAAATDREVFLSESSPFGLPFWNLFTSASEESRRRRLEEGRPGAKCVQGFLKYNSEFTEKPICAASRQYQKAKLEHLPEEGLNDEQFTSVKRTVLAKSCICYDLAGCATRKYGLDAGATPCICCGPNIVNFNRIYTLEEMVGHIYGRLSLIVSSERPHMFIKELSLYVEYLKGEMESYRLRLSSRTPKYFDEFRENLLSGVEHYRGVAEQFIEEKKARFLRDLEALRMEIEGLQVAETS